MKPLLVIRHTTHVSPGYLQTRLEQQGLPFILCRRDRGDALPTHLDDHSGLILLGGTMSVNDEPDWLEAELALIRQARQTDRPVLGICLGGQLIAKALGAEVRTGHDREIGWHRVAKTAAGKASPFLSGLDDDFAVFQWHGDTFAIPPGAQHLLRNDCYENQAFSIGNILALQFHPEMTRALILDWLGRSKPDADAACTQGAQAILAGLDDRLAGLNRVAERLLLPWLGLLNTPASKA